MGNLCDAFGITKIEAPYTTRRRIQKKQTRPSPKRPVKTPPPFGRKEHFKPLLKRKSATKKKKRVVCFKFEKIGHKAF